MTTVDRPQVAPTVELLPLDSLVPNPRNPKLHANGNIEASINRFGMVEPVVVDRRTGFIISGHGRTETLRAMHDNGDPPPDGITVTADGGWLVPVVTSWASTNDQEAAAALVALNQIGVLGGWDTRQLADILQSLTDDVDQFAVTGYTPADLALLLKTIEADDQFKADHTGVVDEFLSITNTGPESFNSALFRSVYVVFANEADVRAFYDRLGVPYDATERSFAWPRPLPSNKIEDHDA